MLKKGASTKEIENILISANQGVGQRSLAARLGRMLRQAGLPISPTRFVMFQAALAILVALGASGYFVAPIAFALGVVVGGLVPLLVVSIKRSARMEKLTAQLPDALDLMARGLQVGHPLSVTVGNVASDMPDPIGSEFGLIQDQVSYGDDITEAFVAFAERVDNEDARYTAVSVNIQHGTGGNLSHVLRVLSRVIRDRATMRKKIRAISAEGRLSAVILSFLPFGIFGVINFTSPAFYGEVWGDPLFYFFGGSALALILLQAFILFRMVNFKF